eukprot:scpid94325/ scgid29039/ 
MMARRLGDEQWVKAVSVFLHILHMVGLLANRSSAASPQPSPAGILRSQPTFQYPKSPGSPGYSMFGTGSGRPYRIPHQASPSIPMLFNGHEVIVRIGNFRHDTATVELRTMPVNPGHLHVWQLAATLNFSSLPSPCKRSDTFRPSLAVSPTQTDLIFFGFGPHPLCNQVFVWTEDTLHKLNITGGERVAHYLHSIAALPYNVDGKSKKPYRLLSYGGLLCDSLWAKLRENCIASNVFWQLVIHNSSKEGTWQQVQVTDTWMNPPALVAPTLLSTGSSIILTSGFTETYYQLKRNERLWTLNFDHDGNGSIFLWSRFTPFFSRLRQTES